MQLAAHIRKKAEQLLHNHRMTEGTGNPETLGSCDISDIMDHPGKIVTQLRHPQETRLRSAK